MPQTERDQAMFDEAVRVGNDCVRKANRYLQANKLLVEGVSHALLLLNSGRTEQARDRLNRALEEVEKKMRPA